MTWSWPDCEVRNVKQLARKILKDSKLKIVTQAGTEYSLPALWSISDAGAYTFRNKLEDKAFSHGGNVVGMAGSLAVPSRWNSSCTALRSRIMTMP